MDGLHEAVWFFIGIFSYRIISRIFMYGHMAIHVKAVGLQSLELLGKVVQDFAFVKELKYNSMRKANISEEEIKKYKILDNHSLDNWKQATISNYIHTYPPLYRSSLKFKNWKEAMLFLGEEHKKRNAEAKKDELE